MKLPVEHRPLFADLPSAQSERHLAILRLSALVEIQRQTHRATAVKWWSQEQQYFAPIRARISPSA